VFTRSITLDDLVEKVCERLGIKGRAIIWSQAEACMDVDKPHQLEMLRADLEKQQRRAAAKEKRAAKAKTAKRTAVLKTAKSTTTLRTKPAPAGTTASRASRTTTTAKAKPKKK
jgi:hypothetical protein